MRPLNVTRSSNISFNLTHGSVSTVTDNPQLRTARPHNRPRDLVGTSILHIWCKLQAEVETVIPCVQEGGSVLALQVGYEL